MAYAETQSMFCDSILGDADWLTRYAKKIDGAPMPSELIKKRIERSQPFRAFDKRMLLVVPYFERALYALGDSISRPTGSSPWPATPKGGYSGSRVPGLSWLIPHLLNQEASAGYHGYLLADMAVYQTRVWLLDRYGYIADNPEVGRLLAEKYWGAWQFACP